VSLLFIRPWDVPSDRAVYDIRTDRGHAGSTDRPQSYKTMLTDERIDRTMLTDEWIDRTMLADEGTVLQKILYY
jgi:hypothetical protein